MKIKHYRAPDMRQALRQVREAQGPDAVILSSRGSTAASRSLRRSTTTPASVEQGHEQSRCSRAYAQR